MNDVKIKVTALENSVAENTANIQINASNISALQTSKQDVIEDLETIRDGASAGATAVQPNALDNYLPLSGGAITGNIENRSDYDGWKAGFEWFYNNERFAYVHAFTDGTKGEKSLTIQADTDINLISQNLFFNGKTTAYSYNSTTTTVRMFVGSVLTSGAKVVSFVVPININGSPTISFTSLKLRFNGDYLFGSTASSDVTTSYTFTSTVIYGGLNVVINFSDADTKAINNSCIISEIILKLTY